MTQEIGLDFETYGAVNLPKHGLHRYVNDPSFMPLIGHVHYEDDRGIEQHQAFDFTTGNSREKVWFKEFLYDNDAIIAAHNAPFEEAVIDWLGINTEHFTFTDTAVIARALGFGSKLEAAAPQMLGVDKMAEGWDLIKLFSMPGKVQEANDSDLFDPDIKALYPLEWDTFNEYCHLDAKLSYRIARDFSGLVSLKEWRNNDVTRSMNDIGWRVDLDSVRLMQGRYEDNLAALLEWFYATYQSGLDEDKRLNFKSFKQLQEFCAARGVKAKSFDELHVKKLRKAIFKKMSTMPQGSAKHEDYRIVNEMLNLKQELGGSSLTKLQTIIDMTSADGKLRGQYLHVGAGQSYRTSGKGVQLQNLKRLRDQIDMDDLLNPNVEFDNEVLAQNIRQVFTASDPHGALIVGDFSSVESRGLAWLARAEWKLDEFRKGRDMYKVLAAKIDNTEYDDVTKDRRQFGKVGELSCGYGAGPDAVRAFAEKMGTDLTEVESAALVRDWRAANPEIVQFWYRLDDMLHAALDPKNQPNRQVQVAGAQTFHIGIETVDTPASLLALRPEARTIKLTLRQGNSIVLARYFHGCYVHGRNVRYFKPSELKSGDLWRDNFVDPKTKQRRHYTIYGGKLTGILTQSLCREMFFDVLRTVHDTTKGLSYVDLMGQFHDEIVLDWRPQTVNPVTGNKGLTLDETMTWLESRMSDEGIYTGFPLAAEVKCDYRYTK